jgi:uncharacterized membrane protein YuzA (DUF378 family)
MNLIKAFLKKLFSKDDEVSSKRVVGVIAFLLVVEAVQVELFGAKTMVDYMFYGLIGLIAACFGLNAIIDIKKKNEPNDVS